MSDKDYIGSLFSLEGRVALVTGASSGIGCHLAGALANAGAQVVALARRKERLDEIAEDGRIAAFEADLSDVEDYDGLAAGVSASFGAPTILLNAAGVNFRQPADEITAE
ncbi:MAG: SDR family NAD(P)-dependent oxidoreductase, partial [Pseudomonadota bacterium]